MKMSIEALRWNDAKLQELITFREWWFESPLMDIMIRSIENSNLSDEII